MQEMKVMMGTIDKVKRFVEIISNYEEDIDLIRGSYVVDAKSIMGIFTMDLSAPLLLRAVVSEKRFDEIKRDLCEYAI